jgi:hypothetical protein
MRLARTGQERSEISTVGSRNNPLFFTNEAAVDPRLDQGELGVIIERHFDPSRWETVSGRFC